MSAADHERLPPGGFSLKQGFPDWFPHKSKAVAAVSIQSSLPDESQTPPRPPPKDSQPTAKSVSAALVSLQDSAIPTGRSVSMYEVLRYMRSVFDDEAVLDAVELSSSGNPGAWHAWRTHRIDSGHVFANEEGTTEVPGDAQKDVDSAAVPATPAPAPAAAPAGSAVRHGEWNWQGVWEERVKRGISASLTESSLYGGMGTNEDAVSLAGDIYSIRESANGRCPNTDTLREHGRG